METSTFVIISVLALAFAVLVHFQIIRYLYLHCASSEKFIEKYKTLKTTPKKKVAITFPVANVNKNVKPMINSVLDQTVRVDSIVCVIPDDVSETTLPDSLKKTCFVSKCKKLKDKSSENCIVPALLREDTADTVIFILDPDYVYGKDFIQTLVEEMETSNQPLISRGALVFKPLHFREGVSANCDAETDVFSMMNKPFKKYSYNETYRTIR